MRLDDAELHALGTSQFTGDLPPPEGLLFVQPVGAEIAHGSIRQLDVSEALAFPGVVAVLTAADNPGLNQIGNVASDEVLLAEKEVVYHGQPVALVVAESADIARQAAKRLKIVCEPMPAVFDAREADRLGMLSLPGKPLAAATSTLPGSNAR